MNTDLANKYYKILVFWFPAVSWKFMGKIDVIIVTLLFLSHDCFVLIVSQNIQDSCILPINTVINLFLSANLTDRGFIHVGFNIKKNTQPLENLATAQVTKKNSKDSLEKLSDLIRKMIIFASLVKSLNLTNDFLDHYNDFFKKISNIYSRHFKLIIDV